MDFWKHFQHGPFNINKYAFQQSKTYSKANHIGEEQFIIVLISIELYETNLLENDIKIVAKIRLNQMFGTCLFGMWHAFKDLDFDALF